MALRIPHEMVVEAVAEDVPLYVAGHEVGLLREVEIEVVYDEQYEGWHIARAWLVGEDNIRTQFNERCIWSKGFGMAPNATATVLFGSLERHFKTAKFQSYVESLFEDALRGRQAA